MEKIAYNDANLTDTVVALGKFEGVHKGHMLLINKVMQLARETGKQAVMFTIDMPDSKRIYTIKERDRLFEDFGIDINITCDFSKKFASMKPEIFVRDILVGRLHPAYVVVGKDFCFGKNRTGDVSTLEEQGQKYGFTVVSFDKLMEGDTIISSSVIRELLLQGDVLQASKLMGRNYSVSGIVQHGKQLGATIGFPTVNLIPDADKLLVPNGVYESCIWINGRKYKGVTNVGDNPTVDMDRKIKVETHILFYDENLYGKYLNIEFVRFIRKEIKFDSIQALKNQIKSDTIEVAHQ